MLAFCRTTTATIHIIDTDAIIFFAATGIAHSPDTAVATISHSIIVAQLNSIYTVGKAIPASHSTALAVNRKGTDATVARNPAYGRNESGRSTMYIGKKKPAKGTMIQFATANISDVSPKTYSITGRSVALAARVAESAPASQSGNFAFRSAPLRGFAKSMSP